MKELNFGGNMFVVNLAVADLIISAFISPMNIVGKYLFFYITFLNQSSHGILELKYLN